MQKVYKIITSVLLMSLLILGTLAPTVSAATLPYPSFIKATPISSTQIFVEWGAVSGAWSYNVYRSSGGNYTKIGSTISSSYAYADKTCSPATSYSYYVCGVNGSGEGQSAGTNATTFPDRVPSAPTNPWTAPGITQISIGWSAASEASSYKIYRSTSSHGPFTTLVGTAPGLGFTDNSLICGTTYYYMLTGLNSLGEGAGVYVNATTLLPDSTNNILYAPPVKNQFQEGSCTAFMATELREYWELKQGKPFVALSPQAFYYWERLTTGTTNSDGGSTVPIAFSVAKNTGFCPETDDPYGANVADPYGVNGANNVYTNPLTVNANVLNDAIPYKIQSFTDVFALGYPTHAQDIKKAMADGNAVGLGINLTDTFAHPSLIQGMYIADTSNVLTTQHAILALDYKPDPTRPGKSLFLIQNDDGTIYANGGYAWLTEDFVNNTSDCSFAYIMQP